MKKIVLIRHAKSSWDYPIEDVNRPITDEGIQKTIKIALRTKDLIPKESILWSSIAVRTTQTAKICMSYWDLDSKNEITFKPELYTFDSNALERCIKSCSDDYDNLILFGHNSAITDFVNKFGDKFVDNVPTSGFVSIIFETTSWNKITKGNTETLLFPRDI